MNILKDIYPSYKKAVHVLIVHRAISEKRAKIANILLTVDPLQSFINYTGDSVGL